MGSHSVTCHPAEVILPTTLAFTSTHFTIPRKVEGWVDSHTTGCTTSCIMYMQLNENLRWNHSTREVSWMKTYWHQSPLSIRVQLASLDSCVTGLLSTAEQSSCVDIAVGAVCRDIAILTSFHRLSSFPPSTQILQVSYDHYIISASLAINIILCNHSWNRTVTYPICWSLSLCRESVL